MNVQNLVENGKIKEAIKVLVDNKIRGAVNLSARFNQLNKRINDGVIRNSEREIEMNLIVKAILDFDEESDLVLSSKSTRTANHLISGDSIGILQQIMKNNRRRNKPVYNEASSLLGEFRNYDDTKKTNLSFDVTGRRERALKGKLSEFVERVSEKKADDLESIIQRITDFLKDDTPSWENLQDAYDLAAGRGFSDEWMVGELNQRTDDDEIKWDICDKLEAYCERIKVK